MRTSEHTCWDTVNFFVHKLGVEDELSRSGYTTDGLDGPISLKSLKQSKWLDRTGNPSKGLGFEGTVDGFDY